MNERPPLIEGVPGSLSGPPKPAFPAYQNADNMSLPTENPLRQANKLPPVGAGCKLIHPEEDLSMVSLNTGSEELQWKLR